jgi:phage gp36-like protein
MALISPAYTTFAQIERYLSLAGAEAFASHDVPDEPTAGVYDDVVNQATDEINLYLIERYLPAGLAGSTLVNRWATTLGAYFLTLRRGNPPPNSLAVDYERVIKLLERIQAGTLNIPNVATRSRGPVWDNLTVDRRYHQQKLRVQKENSSDSPTGLRQHQVDYISPADY